MPSPNSDERILDALTAAAALYLIGKGSHPKALDMLSAALREAMARNEQESRDPNSPINLFFASPDLNQGMLQAVAHPKNYNGNPALPRAAASVAEQIIAARGNAPYEGNSGRPTMKDGEPGNGGRPRALGQQKGSNPLSLTHQ